MIRIVLYAREGVFSESTQELFGEETVFDVESVTGLDEFIFINPALIKSIEFGDRSLMQNESEELSIIRMIDGTEYITRTSMIEEVLPAEWRSTQP